MVSSGSVTLASIKLNDLDSIKKGINSIKKKKQILKRGLDMKKIAQQVDRLYINPLLDELKTYPPPRNSGEPVEWKTDRQRKYMMMLMRNKKIVLPYRRTGALASGWNSSVSTKSRGVGIAISVENKSSAAPYVVGRVGFGVSQKSIKTYEKPIQPFHRKTGWAPAHVKVNQAFKKAKAFVESEVENQLNELFNV